MSRIALAGAVDGAVLLAAGWQVVGALPLTPFDAHPADLRDVPSYAGVEDLLADGALDAVALDAADSAARHLPAMLARGLHVLLTSPDRLDPEVLPAARAAQVQAEVAVVLAERWEPWALTVAAALPLVGTPVLQATVRGWPAGPAAAAELVDLARGWCGDVVAATAAPAPLPADELAPGVPVAWSLLHASGATTLVSHGGGPVLVRLSCATARLEAGPAGCRWVGGAELPLLETPDRREHPAARAPGVPAGLLSCAVDLERAVAAGAVPTAQWPWPADLGDLQAAGRVLEALRASSRARTPVKLA